MDDAGNVYVTGGDSSGDYVTVKYDAIGSELWVARFTSGARVPSGMALDIAGNVYVTGSYIVPGGDSDSLIVKYDTHGNQIWVARYPHGSASAVTLDSTYNCYVTGASAGDFVTIKYVQTPPGPRLTSPGLFPTGGFQFTLIGEAGKVYEIQGSTNLLTWTALTNFVSATGTNPFTDTTSPNFSRRFYRAVSP